MNINDSNIKPELTFKRLVYLHMQQLTNFPYIEKDFDALTDYELLCLVVKYLNDVIDNSNEQNTSITNLYNAFLQLQTYMNNSVQELEDAWNDKTTELEDAWNDKTTELETAFNNLQTWINNYFDNLDVQEEINNKLDKMLEDGVLEQIIEQFLQSTALWCFDTVASMKSATNLTNGSYTKTLGYYVVNDGGSSTYKIRTKTNDDVVDESIIIALSDNTLVAELIPNYEFSSVAFGDPITSTDDSILLQRLFDYVSDKKLHLHLRYNKIYNLSDRIKINSNLYLDMNNSTFKLNDNTDKPFLYNMDNYTTQSSKIENVTIKNGTFNGNSETNYNDNLSGMVLILYNGNNINIEKINVIDCQRNPFNIFETSNISFKNILFKDICKRVGSYISGGNYCINMENRDNYESGSQCNIENITLDSCGGHFIHCFNYSFCNINNLNIINPYDNSNLHSVNLTYTKAKNCNISNVYVEGGAKNFCEVNQGSENIQFNNIKVLTSENGFVFGPNTDLTSINKNIYINDSDILSTAFVFIYNYADNCYMNNCNFNGGLGGADNNASNLYINNCNITAPTNRLFTLRQATLYKTKINEWFVETLSRNYNADMTLNFDLDARSNIDIPLYLLNESLRGSRNFKLSLDSYFASDPKQNYQALYLYTSSDNTTDVGLLSSVIADIGSQYRKITPTITTHNSIHIETTSDVNLKCQIHLTN